MHTNLLLLEGEDVQELLLRVHREYGTRAKVVRAQKQRRGGVFGFFARPSYEIAIEVTEASEAAAGVPAPRESEESSVRASVTPSELPIPNSAPNSAPSVVDLRALRDAGIAQAEQDAQRPSVIASQAAAARVYRNGSTLTAELQPSVESQPDEDPQILSRTVQEVTMSAAAMDAHPHGPRPAHPVAGSHGQDGQQSHQQERASMGDQATEGGQPGSARRRPGSVPGGQPDALPGDGSAISGDVPTPPEGVAQAAPFAPGLVDATGQTRIPGAAFGWAQGENENVGMLNDALHTEAARAPKLMGNVMEPTASAPAHSGGIAMPTENPASIPSPDIAQKPELPSFQVQERRPGSRTGREAFGDPTRFETSVETSHGWFSVDGLMNLIRRRSPRSAAPLAPPVALGQSPRATGVIAESRLSNSAQFTSHSAPAPAAPQAPSFAQNSTQPVRGAAAPATPEAQATAPSPLIADPAQFPAISREALNASAAAAHWSGPTPAAHPTPAAQSTDAVQPMQAVAAPSVPPVGMGGLLDHLHEAEVPSPAELPASASFAQLQEMVQTATAPSAPAGEDLPAMTANPGTPVVSESAPALTEPESAPHTPSVPAPVVPDEQVAQVEPIAQAESAAQDPSAVAPSDAAAAPAMPSALAYREPSDDTPMFAAAQATLMSAQRSSATVDSTAPHSVGGSTAEAQGATPAALTAPATGAPQPAPAAHPASIESDQQEALVTNRRLLRALGVPASWTNRLRAGERFSSVLEMLKRIPQTDLDERAERVIIIGTIQNAELEAHRTAIELPIANRPRPVYIVQPHDESSLLVAAAVEGPCVIAVQAPDDVHALHSMLRKLQGDHVIAIMDARTPLSQVTAWVESLERVDGICIEGAMDSREPAAFLHLELPVLRLDGVAVDRYGWTALLCAHLEMLDGTAYGQS